MGLLYLGILKGVATKMTLLFTIQSQKIQWSNPTRAPVEGSAGEVYAQFTVDPEWEGRTITAVFSNEEGGAPLPEPILWTGEPVKVPASVLVDGILRVGLVGIKDGKTLTTRYMERGVPVYRSGGTGGEAIDPDPTLWEQVLSAMGNLADLDTFDKSSLVSAINEVYRTGGGGTGGGGFPFDLDENTLAVKDGVLRVNTIDRVEQDNTQPITSGAVYTEFGKIVALLETI